MAERASVAGAWEAFGSVIGGDRFRSSVDAFIDAHCDEFEADEEHKLSHTALHNQYVPVLNTPITAFAI